MADWGIVYYKTKDGVVPAEDYLDACAAKIEARLLAVLEAVRAAPPPAFSGGGKWEAMHGSMTGYFEIRVTGPGRTQYRLFCILENGTEDELAARGIDGPQIVVLNGLTKPPRVLFGDGEYKKNVRDLADDYRSTLPRRIA